MARKTVLGLVVGNRGFFPDHLCREGRETMLKVLKRAGLGVVTLGPEDTPFGSVETREEAKTCAELFRRRAARIDGILVTLPNFGDERGVADAVKLSGLDVPVLVHAFPDEPAKMSIRHRRDSFCGKMSACNNLMQYGLRYSLTRRHTVDPESDAFRRDLDAFAACCRVVRGLRGARIGAIGARPAAFNTVRFSEKILETAGISVETIDLFEVFGRVGRLKDGAPAVRSKLKAIKDYVSCRGIPADALLKMAKFGAVVDAWIEEQELDATAVQCWTAMEEFFGVVPCTVMSMLSDRLLPSACEVDVTGAVGMLAMRLASGRPSALLDWNNNYGDDPDACVLFHCSNLPKTVFAEAAMGYQEIIAGDVGKANTYGTCVGPLKPGPFTYARVSTDDAAGTVRAYLGEGELVPEPLKTFGGYGVARIPDLQGLLRFICAHGFEHHVAMNPSRVAAGVFEALANYLGWDVYYHGGSVADASAGAGVIA
ncbi:MAG: L-fucose/L-arabinose isomerase family protein [Lentisphaerae bacterium]|nr:L-fucose/L-arabinose isomerase family protein [Lentisphaerota bacterium]